MKNSVKYSSIYDIRLAKERLKFEARLHEEKLRNTNNYLVSSFALSLRNLSFTVKNRLIGYSLFRSIYRSNAFYEFIKNFIRGFSKSR